MLTVPRGVRLFVLTEATDFRKSFDGLSALVRRYFDMSPTSGDLFLFMNRRATQVRILYWDGDGFCLFMKRLEKGTFRRRAGPQGQQYAEITGLELSMLLEGMDAERLRKRRRYSKAA